MIFEFLNDRSEETQESGLCTLWAPQHMAFYRSFALISVLSTDIEAISVRYPYVARLRILCATKIHLIFEFPNDRLEESGLFTLWAPKHMAFYRSFAFPFYQRISKLWSISKAKAKDSKPKPGPKPKPKAQSQNQRLKAKSKRWKPKAQSQSQNPSPI